jgi:hypothetical protein
MRTAVAEISASLVSIAAAGPLSASSDIGRERSKFRPFRYEGIVRVAIDDGIISPTAKLGLHPERFMSGSIQYAHVSNSAGKRWLERTNFGMLPCHRILQSPALPRFCPRLQRSSAFLSRYSLHFRYGAYPSGQQQACQAPETRRSLGIYAYRIECGVGKVYPHS